MRIQFERNSMALVPAWGPIVAGRFADRVGFRVSLRFALLSQAIAVFLPVLVTGPIALMRFLFGMFVGSLYLYAAVANLSATRALHPGLAVEGSRAGSDRRRGQ